MVKSAANAGLPLLGPRQLGTQGFLCFSNIYPLIARGTAWDRKQDGVLLGPGTATVHTHIHQDKHEKQTDGQIRTHTCTQFLTRITVLIMMAAAMWQQPVLSYEVARGRVQGVTRGPSADRLPLFPGRLLSHLGLPSRQF